MKMKSKQVIDNYEYERKLYNEGYEYLCGTDEVGRGPLIGPVVAAAVIMPKNEYIEGVTDSKKLSDKKRREYKKIIEEKALSYAVAFVSPEVIDEINIREATIVAMKTAIKQLSVKPDCILSDALALDIDEIVNISIIKGDLKSFTIACASILAKVARDDYMDELDKQYSQYNFKKNKGYPTKEHLAALNEFGVLPEHRKTFGPVTRKIEETKRPDVE